MKAPLGFLLTFLITLAYPVCAQDGRVSDRRIRATPSATSDGAKRVALVIGNSAYQMAPLRNPVNDARAMAQALREFGFEVIHKENLTQEEMKGAIRAFGKKIAGSEVSLFYFAGHGVNVGGSNYLMPVDAHIENEADVEDQGVNANFVLRQMDNDREDSMNIVILDACRNNPFARGYRSSADGLARIDAPNGTIIAYATAPGSVASDGGNAANGLYTQELLRFMRTSGLSIEDVFKRVRVTVRQKTQNKQSPWWESSFSGEFYFTRNSKAPGNSTTKAQSIMTTTKEIPQTSLSSLGLPPTTSPKIKSAYTPIYGSEPFSDYRPLITAPLAGNLSEIIEKHKVYIETSSAATTEDEFLSAGSGIAMQLKGYPGLEIVETPESSDFIIYCKVETNTDIGSSPKTVWDMIVIVRGEAQADGTHLARAVWKDHDEERRFKRPRPTPSRIGVLGMPRVLQTSGMTLKLINALKKLRGE
jgi:hypothetical protein